MPPIVHGHSRRRSIWCFRVAKLGLDNPQSVADFISEKVNAHLDPLPEWSLIPHEIEGKAVIEAAVKEGNQTPYYLNLDGTRKAYIRSGNESVPTEPYQLVNLILKGDEYHLGCCGNPRASGRSFFYDACQGGSGEDKDHLGAKAAGVFWSGNR